MVVQKTESIGQLAEIAPNGGRGEACWVRFYQIKEICRRAGFVQKLLGRGGWQNEVVVMIVFEKV